MERILPARRWWLAAFMVLWVAWGSREAYARDLWTALAEMESGNKDGAVGVLGEISRYQIRPEIWERYASPEASWRNGPDALVVAQKIMEERCAKFEQTFHRPPTTREFYILWNAPAQVKNPHRGVAERADRFCNLVESTRA
jgi:hypothetical protein